MAFQCYEHDVNHPSETKEAFVKRFLESLPGSIALAKSSSSADCNALIVHDELQNWGFLRSLCFWKSATVDNLPPKAKWACEALTANGYEFEIGKCGGVEFRPSYVAVFVKLPG